jgi:hypothetical protein
MNHHVVVWDPDEKYWEGSLVDHPVATIIRGRGGVALPVDPSLFQISGNGGFFKRAWGAGWPCDHQTPRHFCPLSIFVMKDHKIVHWAARLVPDERFADAAKSGPPDDPGTITLMAMTPRANTFQAPLTPRTNAKRIRDLGPCDANGGWTIEGNAFANIAFDGHHSFALYGTGSGVRVAWAAITAVKG